MTARNRAPATGPHGRSKQDRRALLPAATKLATLSAGNPVIMSSSFRQFRKNAGLFSLIRIGVVGLMLLGICVFLVLRAHQPAPLLGFLAGVALPFFARERLIDGIEASSRAARIFGIALVVSAAVIGAAREHLAPLLENWLFVSVFFSLAALYIGLFIVMYSDVRVEIRR